MANSFFQFKQFTVHQDRCAMKVGTDGVLLGAWTNIDNAARILDIGTGTGLIALMLAQRSTAKIDAVDIDKEAFIQAKENSKASPFAERIDVIHSSIEAFAVSHPMISYDLIVSNPPYFISSLKSPDKQRTVARHTDSLSLNTLLEESCRLLNPEGRIALILPYDQEKTLLSLALSTGLRIIRTTTVYPTPESKPKRLLVELARTSSSHKTIEADSLTIEISRHQYTPEYKELTKAFYLKA